MSAGLTDLARRPHTPLREDAADARLQEVMLYFGNDCNRDCGFCCVEGRPGGSFRPFRRRDVRTIAARIRPDARIKLYGGEPTLHHRHLIRVTAELRAHGYVGRLTIFSNGVQARRLIEMLDADPPAGASAGSDAYLNQAIWRGEGAPVIPPGRRRQLLDWASGHPGRLFLGHEDVLPVGAAEANAATFANRPAFGGRCARCHPTLHSDGRVHACAFAAEVRSPVYALGTLDDEAAHIASRRARFIDWIEREVEPAATRRGVPPCTECLERARALTTIERAR